MSVTAVPIESSAALSAGRKTTLWVREDDVLQSIRKDGENRFLPGITLPEDLMTTGDLNDAVQSEALLLAVPAQVLHGFAQSLAPLLKPGTPLVICAKGIEKHSGKLVNEVLCEAVKDCVPEIEERRVGKEC